MKCVVVMISKAGPLAAEELSRAGQRLARVAPFRHLPNESTLWTSSTRRFAVLECHARPSGADQPIEPGSRDGQTCLTFSGMLIGTPPPVPRTPHEVSLFERGLRDQSGVFSAFLAQEQLDLALAQCLIARVEPVFWYEGRRSVVISNRALAAHLIGADRDRPTYDVLGTASFLNTGFYCDESVPFAGVSILPPDSSLRVQNGRIHVHQHTSLSDLAERREISDDVYDRLAQSWINSLEPLRHLDTPIQLGLTGGKDSRVLAAGLSAAKIPYTSYIVDYGTANATDVQASVAVAKALGVPHEVRGRTETQKAESVTADLFKQTCECLRLTDGMLSGYERVPMRRNCVNVTMLGGNGGDLLRCGYGAPGCDVSVSGVRARIRDQAGMHAGLLRRGPRRRLLQYCHDWVTPFKKAPVAALDAFSLYYRCGRWSAAARAGYSAFQRLHQPLF